MAIKEWFSIKLNIYEKSFSVAINWLFFESEHQKDKNTCIVGDENFQLIFEIFFPSIIDRSREFDETRF